MSQKNKMINIRMSEEDRALLDELAKLYGIDRSQFIRFAMEHIRETKPAFQVLPQGKAPAPALYVN